MKSHLILAIGLCSFLSVAGARADMQDQVDGAALLINNFQNGNSPVIPAAVLKRAKGLVIAKITKGGLVFSGQSGNGVVVARTPSGTWSGPAAITISGGGFGLLAGGSVSQVVLVLNTKGALKQFTVPGEIKFSGNMQAVAGPTNTAEMSSVERTPAVYRYIKRDGVFAGMSVEGTKFTRENDLDAEYYGRPVTFTQIFSGQAQPPHGASKLLNILNAYPAAP